MEVLLDTHALVWWFEGAAGLSKRASLILANTNNTILVSAVVGWELAIKVNLGKIRPAALVHDLLRLLEQESCVEVPISLEHATRAGLLPVLHRDPFDRLLVAQAQALDVPILSADAVLDGYGVRRIW